MPPSQHPQGLKTGSCYGLASDPVRGVRRTPVCSSMNTINAVVITKRGDGHVAAMFAVFTRCFLRSRLVGACRSRARAAHREGQQRLRDGSRMTIAARPVADPASPLIVHHDLHSDAVSASERRSEHRRRLPPKAQSRTGCASPTPWRLVGRQRCLQDTATHQRARSCPPISASRIRKGGIEPTMPFRRATHRSCESRQPCRTRPAPTERPCVMPGQSAPA